MAYGSARSIVAIRYYVMHRQRLVFSRRTTAEGMEKRQSRGARLYLRTVTKPRVVVLEFALPGLDGTALSALESVSRSHGPTRVYPSEKGAI